MNKYICSIDQGTTSTRAILFNHSGEICFSSQIEHKQYYPKPGWVEHDANEIWRNTQKVLHDIAEKADIQKPEIMSIGITNQRETVVAWDWLTGEPLCRAIVWQDQRTSDFIDELMDRNSGIDSFRVKTGLPLSPYFSASKMKWMMEEHDSVKDALKRGSLCFGTIDSWVVYKLSGGMNGGIFITDTTNASRTLLMDIETRSWDPGMLDIFNIPQKSLPDIKDSVPDRPFALTFAECPLGEGIPVSGILGDQQAALFGQTCFEKGSCKCTYGTGCFLLLNTGQEIVQSGKGLITTVGYTRSGEKPVYALEGSVAIAGSLVQWLRDNMKMIEKSADMEKLAAEVEDCGDIYIVPAFSGLFAPYWRSDARGIIAGMTGYTQAGHIARAVLEATAFQTMEIIQAMIMDSGQDINELRVDGGMTVNEMLMQFQSDIADIPVVRPLVTETTALGAAYAAGLASGFWKNTDDLKKHWKTDKKWFPAMDKTTAEQKRKKWAKAVNRTFDWMD